MARSPPPVGRHGCHQGQLAAWAEQHVTSATAGVLNGTTPLITFGLAIATRTERGTLAKAAGLALGFIGVLVIAAPWRDETLAASGLGATACVAAAGSYGVTYIYQRRFLAQRGEPPIGLAAGQLALGTVLLGIAAPFITQEQMHLTPPVVLAALALGVLGTGAAYAVNYRLIEDLGATRASVVTYPLPVVAVTLGAIVLSEPVTWNLIAGTVAVLLGVALVEGRLGVSRSVQRTAM